MQSIVYRQNFIPRAEEIRVLYEDAGWSTYTFDMPRLMQAMRCSLLVITAWDEDALCGLIRVVGDGLTIIYIQDLLVKKSHQRNGIGAALVRGVCYTYHNVRQKVLMTDDTPSTRAFYESLGFLSCDKGELVSFVKFD